MIGKLYITATPIGNLEDITLRALRIFREVDYILCEDTRITKRILQRYDIKNKKLISYHAHSTEKQHEKIISDLLSGKKIALVSDAGTPGVSDPGVRLVGRAREAGASLEVIPGPSAVTAALSLAGIGGNKFTFLGFVPQKKGRETFLKNLHKFEVKPLIFFESTHRIIKLLSGLKQYQPQFSVYVARELTKVNEEFLIGTPAELLDILSSKTVKQKGEFVIICK